MTDAYVHVNGHPLTECTLHRGNMGPWFAECEFEGSPSLSGRVTLAIGPLQLSGTIQPNADGSFAQQKRCRIVGGSGGWQRPVTPKSYASDAGVLAINVVTDLALEVGETIGTFEPANARLGAAYARCAVDRMWTATTTLEDVIGSVAWWVDDGGITHVGSRPAAPAAERSYELLEFDSTHRVAMLAVDDPGAISIGSVLTDPRLDAPITVRAIELRVSGRDQKLRLRAWCGSSERSRDRTADALERIVSRVGDQRMFGKWRYRVIKMQADRVQLQALSRMSGLPDLLAVDMSPGAAGWHATLPPGAEVLVEFVEGDRSLPIIAGFPSKGQKGHVPDAISVGGGTLPAARQGELVQCGGVGTVATFSPVPPAAGGPLATGVPYLVSFGPFAQPQAPLYGAVLTGSPKLQVP